MSYEGEVRKKGNFWGKIEEKTWGKIIVADWLRITYRFCENAGMNFNLRMNVSGILPLAVSSDFSFSLQPSPPDLHNFPIYFFLVALLQRARRYLGVPLYPVATTQQPAPCPPWASSGHANFAAENCVCFSARMLRRGSFVEFFLLPNEIFYYIS